jgi:hypothetical protein
MRDINIYGIMKYLKSFDCKILESNRFLHFKEVLAGIEDRSLFFKDLGFDVTFGIMSGDANNASFDDLGYNQDTLELFIMKASLGKVPMWVKLDYHDLGIDAQLSPEQLKILIETIRELYHYINEELQFINFWSKQVLSRRRYEFIKYYDVEELISEITKLNSSVDHYSLDVRIVFTGQPIIKESTSDLQVHQDDLNDIEELVKEFNEELKDSERTDIEASTMRVMRRIVNKSGKKITKPYLTLIISDMTEDYSGFEFVIAVPLILRMMNMLGLEKIEIGVLKTFVPNRKWFEISKSDLLDIYNGDYHSSTNTDLDNLILRGDLLIDISILLSSDEPVSGDL